MAMHTSYQAVHNPSPSSSKHRIRETDQLHHIALVTETFKPDVNGVSTTLEQLILGLIDKQVSVQLVKPRRKPTYDTESPFLDIVEVPSCPIPFYADLRFGLPVYQRLLKAWSARRPDAIYIATEGPLGFVAVKAAKKLNIPLLSGFHTNFHEYLSMYLFSWLQGSTLRYLKHFHNQTGGTLVPTSPQRESLMKDGFRNVQLLARGVDCELFHPRNRSDELREQWGVKQDDVVMLFVGRLAVEKNLSLLMRTYKELRATSEGKRLKLVMVGDGPLRQKLERKYPSVTFCGKQLGTSLAQHYASADIFAFPSLSETFGNVITEAMASGLAVVGFDYAATQMHIRHYVSGMAIECDKPEEFSAALNELIISPALRGRLSVQARKHVETISWQTVVNQFYQYLLALKAQQCDIPQQALRKWV